MIVGILLVIGFLFYQRQQAQQMQMIIKMKELELQAATRHTPKEETQDGAGAPESKKKK